MKELYTRHIKHSSSQKRNTLLSLLYVHGLYGNLNRLILSLFVFSLTIYSVSAQTPTSAFCSSATGVCTGSSYSFPASTGAASAQAGADYDCLGTQPNPAWFFMQIQNPGSITISMSTNPARDVDFIIWGPFTDPFAQCVTGLTASKVVDCSYSTATSETGTIPNGLAGEYYVLLITNYSNRSTDISFSQTGGTGTSNCDILCNITSLTATPGSCGSGANLGTYAVTGTVNSFTPPTTGTLTVSSSCGSSVTFSPPFATSISYTLPNVTGNGGPCTITASYSAIPTCTRSTTITAPTCCTITPGGNVSVCEGQTINLSATGTTGGSYFWSGPNGFTATTRTPSITNSTTADAGIYSVYLVNGSCTTSVANVTVTVRPLPTAGVTTSGSTTICQGDTVTLSTATGTSLTYQWKRNGNNINTGGTSSSYPAVQSGTYTVVVTQTGCTPSSATSSPVTVTVNTLPTATISAGTTTFCAGDSVTLNANTGTGLTYQWTLNGTNITGATASTYVAKTSGSYRVIVTNSNNCSLTSSAKTVNVVAYPPAVITPSDSGYFCPGGSITLNANTGTGLTYQWRLGGSNVSTNSALAAGIIGNYDVVVTNSTGCKTTSAITVVKKYAVAASAVTTSGPTTICNGDSVVLTASTAVGFTYQWKRNGTNISGQTGSSYIAKTSGSFTVVVTQSMCAIATSTSTAVNVTVNALPTASVTASRPTTFCQGDSVVFSANTGTGLTYQWTLGGTNISGQTGSQLKVKTTGTYAVKVTQNGCTVASSDNPVIANPLPAATLDTAGNTSFCAGSSVLLTGGTIGSGYTYKWKRNGTTITGSTNTYNADSTGNYTVTVTDANNCSATSPAVSVTSRPYPAATITPSGSTTFCTGNSIDLNANTGTGLSYLWQQNGSTISGATSFKLAVTTAGTYNVVVTLNNCPTTSSTTTITVNPRPPIRQIVHE